MTLHLTLKKQWFDMTKAKIKREEYREIKPYWQRRLHVCYIGPGKYGDCQEVIGSKVLWTFPCHKCEHSEIKPFTHVVARNGYAKDAPIITEEIESITIGTGRPEWGAEPKKLYFVIKYKN